MNQEKIALSDNLDMYYTGLVAIAFFGPVVFIHIIYIGASYWSTQIIAMTWVQFADYRGPTLMTVLTQPPFFIGVLLETFPRLIFIYMIYRLYNEKTTKKRVVRTGIISELWLPAIYYLPFLLQMITSPNTIDSIPIVIPIPILFLAGLYMWKKKPTKGLPLVWTVSDSSKDWWKKQSQNAKSDSENRQRRNSIDNT